MASAAAPASRAAVTSSTHASWNAPTPVPAPSTATRIATPSTAPSWRLIENTALPVAKRAGGSEPAAALDSDGITRPTPVPPRICAGRRCVA